jgi:hypothetical protein
MDHEGDPHSFDKVKNEFSHISSPPHDLVPWCLSVMGTAPYFFITLKLVYEWSI